MAIQPVQPQRGAEHRHPLYDSFRLTTTIKVRLGVKRKKGDDEYPQEVDYFVLKPEDGATQDILSVYGDKPKSLRMMLTTEAPRPHEPSPEDRLVLDISNTAWGWNSGLLCRGTGASQDEPGDAIATDERFAQRIAGIVGAKVEKAPHGYKIPCYGQDCPKYRHKIEIPDPNNARKRQLVFAPTPWGQRDPDAPCGLSIVFKALLLHPTDPDPSNILGIAEIASSSINTIRDLVGGFAVMRRLTASPLNPQGRTVGIPFEVIRKPTTTTKVARRTHFTLAIQTTPKVWQRYARIPLSNLFLGLETMAEIKQLLSAEADLASVQDIIPRPLELAAHASDDLSAIEERTRASHGKPLVPQSAATTDGEEAVESAVQPESVDPEDDMQLGPQQIAELKDLCGGREDPDDPQSKALPGVLAKFYSFVHQADREMGREPTRRMSDLRYAHYKWIKAHVEPSAQPGSEEDDDDRIPPPPPEDEPEVVDGPDEQQRLV